MTERRRKVRTGTVSVRARGEINELDWHVRLQPCERLDGDEQMRVMSRLFDVLEPFLETGVVHLDIAMHGPEDVVMQAAEHVFGHLA